MTKLLCPPVQALPVLADPASTARLRALLVQWQRGAAAEGARDQQAKGGPEEGDAAAALEAETPPQDEKKKKTKRKKKRNLPSPAAALAASGACLAAVGTLCAPSAVAALASPMKASGGANRHDRSIIVHCWTTRGATRTHTPTPAHICACSDPHPRPCSCARARALRSAQALHLELRNFLSRRAGGAGRAVASGELPPLPPDVPSKWEWVGDALMVPADAFTAAGWQAEQGA